MELITTYAGIDGFEQEVFLCTTLHSEITDRLWAYALENRDSLASLISEEVEMEEEAALEPGHLLIYYYFADWLADLEDEPGDEFSDDKIYPCVAILPEDIGLTRAAVLEVLSSLPPADAGLGFAH